MAEAFIKIEGQPPSSEIREGLAGSRILLAFSGGKDSLAAWLALRESGVEVVPYFLYGVPDLEFVNREMDRFEQFFGVHIHRYPHPALFRGLYNLIFQPPERCSIIEAARFPRFTYEDVVQRIKANLGFDADGWVADGVRAADSIVRRTAFATHGVQKRTTHKVSVIWDWRISHVRAALSDALLDLPVDYEWFGMSFDGSDRRFLEPLKRHAPKDFERVLDWFPLAELELMRHEL